LRILEDDFFDFAIAVFSYGRAKLKKSAQKTRKDDVIVPFCCYEPYKYKA
jgi:hypothetical protein